MSLWEHIFDKKRLKVWEQVSNEFDGQYIKSSWYGDKIKIFYKNNPIFIDTIDKPGYRFGAYLTRFKVPYVLKKKFYLSVNQKNFIDRIIEKKMKQKFISGLSDFDNRYKVYFFEIEKIDNIIDNSLVNSIVKADILRITTLDKPELFVDYPKNNDLFEIEISGKISDYNRLCGIIDIVRKILENLKQEDLISDDKPSEKYL